MQLATGDMWSVFEQADLFLITTNGILNAHGALVMGAGIARQARDLFPGLEQRFGKAVSSYGPRYGILFPNAWPEDKLGAFQTRQHWREGGDVKLIELARDKLSVWCQLYPTCQVYLNMPGVGLGGLKREVVLPLFSQLPDTVTLWEYHRP